MNEREHITPSFRYVVVVCILSTVLMAVMNIAYTNWVDQKNRAAWCDLLTLIDNQGSAPITTPRSQSAQDYFRLIHQLRETQGCK